MTVAKLSIKDFEEGEFWEESKISYGVSHSEFTLEDGRVVDVALECRGWSDESGDSEDLTFTDIRDVELDEEKNDKGTPDLTDDEAASIERRVVAYLKKEGRWGKKRY